MEKEQELNQLLKEMREDSKKQRKYARLQCIFSVIAMACCVVLLIMGCLVLPRLLVIADQADTVLNNLNTVTATLAEADLDGMVDNMNSLVTASQDGVEQAMEKIDEIDLDTLNQAIHDLADIVKPIAKLFNTFN